MAKVEWLFPVCPLCSPDHGKVIPSWGRAGSPPALQTPLSPNPTRPGRRVCPRPWRPAPGSVRAAATHAWGALGWQDNLLQLGLNLPVSGRSWYWLSWRSAGCCPRPARPRHKQPPLVPVPSVQLRLHRRQREGVWQVPLYRRCPSVPFLDDFLPWPGREGHLAQQTLVWAYRFPSGEFLSCLHAGWRLK